MRKIATVDSLRQLGESGRLAAAGSAAPFGVERWPLEITASDRLATTVLAAPVDRRVRDSRRLHMWAGD